MKRRITEHHLAEGHLCGTLCNVTDEVLFALTPESGAFEPVQQASRDRTAG